MRKLGLHYHLSMTNVIDFLSEYEIVQQHLIARLIGEGS
jgi:hypothetical protein